MVEAVGEHVELCRPPAFEPEHDRLVGGCVVGFDCELDQRAVACEFRVGGAACQAQDSVSGDGGCGCAVGVSEGQRREFVECAGVADDLGGFDDDRLGAEAAQQGQGFGGGAVVQDGDVRRPAPECFGDDVGPVAVLSGDHGSVPGEPPALLVEFDPGGVEDGPVGEQSGEFC